MMRSTGHWGWILAAVAAASVLRILISRFRNYQADLALACEHGCEMPPELPKRWPLGIDRIRELWQSNADGHLLAFLRSIAKDYDGRNNFCQYLCSDHERTTSFILPMWSHYCLRISKTTPASGVVDLQPLFFSLTLDTSTALLFGRSIYSLRASIDQAAENKLFAESFEIAQEGLAKRFRIAPFHFLYSPPDFRRARRNVHQFVERYIRQRKLGKQTQRFDDDFEDGKTPSWFFHQIAAGSASETDLGDQLLNVLLAGRDTTACCLSWAFCLLVRHEEAMKRVREEISMAMRDETHPTREHIKKMPFLACVVKETLRLYPSGPVNNREAIKTTSLPTGGGPDGNSPILVRKGELVVFSQYVNSRMKSIYGEDADAFRPERWETGELSDIGWAYFPFNGGPRQCLGEDFTLMEVSYTLVRLLQAFP
ncbi:cytochrome P450 [Diaporthe eres]|nr:cytochrome P450 [Diaporthe eres]